MHTSFEMLGAMDFQIVVTFPLDQDKMPFLFHETFGLKDHFKFIVLIFPLYNVWG
jgi:hypothetical protein